MNNHLPDTQVLLEYLVLYTKAREESRKSASSRIQYAAQKMTSYITARDPVIDQLNAITNRVTSNIKNSTSFKHWYELIKTLRQEAQEAQSLKTLSSVSLLSETLHGLADLIICELTNNDEFIKKMSELQDAKVQKAKFVSDCIDNLNGDNITTANNEYNSVLQELTILGDIKSINEAMERNKLPTYKRPNITDIFDMDCWQQPTNRKDNFIGNQAAPLCLQPKFCEWLYKIKFQPITLISFDDFKNRAVQKGEQEKLLAKQTSRDSLPLSNIASDNLYDENDEELSHDSPKLESVNESTGQLLPTTSAKHVPIPSFNRSIDSFVSPNVSVTTNSIVAKQVVTSPPASPSMDTLDNNMPTLTRS